MSSPHVVVSAVHEPECSIEEWWKEHKQNLDDFEKHIDHNDDVNWYMSRGKFKSTNSRETYPVESVYHSGRGEDVIEILISGSDDIRDVQESGLEDIIEEINFRLEPDFTLEVYYWYDGVDRPGGISR